MAWCSPCHTTPAKPTGVHTPWAEAQDRSVADVANTELSPDYGAINERKA